MSKPREWWIDLMPDNADELEVDETIRYINSQLRYSASWSKELKGRIADGLQTVSDEMIKAKLAVKYDGGQKPKTNWCKR